MAGVVAAQLGERILRAGQVAGAALAASYVFHDQIATAGADLALDIQRQQILNQGAGTQLVLNKT
jgi:hypothetical protein